MATAAPTADLFAGVDPRHRTYVTADRSAPETAGGQDKRGSHSERLLQGLNELRREGLLCDVTLRVGALSVRAHRAVLASCSPYFRAMFTAQLAEQQKDVIDLRDVHPVALATLVTFAYTGDVQVTDDNVLELLPAASLLQVGAVIAECCAHLHDQLHPTNCIGIGKFAELHACAELHRKCIRYQRKNFADVCGSQEFLQIDDAAEVARLISEDDLVVDSETDVWEAIVRWIKHDFTARAGALLELVSHVRLIYLPLVRLRELLDDPLIRPQISQQQMGVAKMVKKAIEYKTHSIMRLNQDRHSELLLKVPPRQPATVLCAVGGKNDSFQTLNR